MSKPERPARILLRDNTTGEVRAVCDEYWQGDFQWRDGNYSCDCNRDLFFHRAKDPSYKGIEDYRCADERYDVMQVFLPNGEEHPNPESFNYEPDRRIKPPQSS